MKTKSKKEISITAGVLSAISIGCIVTCLLQGKSANNIKGKWKAIDHKFFMDGKKRAETFKEIKQEVNQRI
ncbi:hypothetical protein [Oceanobacillus senegalensis]|uniref:hypothetical protein n=1 Tax=Oceanobacillus senegalensis TaxID=1936063 RepID=UPI000A30B585|nr:hypothetical protein [Oceanobacillus senegalensis]